MTENDTLQYAHQFWEDNEDEYLMSERITPGNRVAMSNDLNAFILIDRLFPNEPGDVVVAAEHDEIYLKGDPQKLFEVDSPATREDILDLIRCGVRYDTDTDGFAMFV